MKRTLAITLRAGASDRSASVGERSLLVCLTGMALFALLAASCDDERVGPEMPGALRVSVITTGGDLDEDGYDVTIDGEHRATVAASGTVVIPDLVAGALEVELTGVATNCAVATESGPNTRPATISGGDTTAVTFDVECVATGVRITAVTSGLDPDLTGFTGSVDAAPPQVIPTNGTLTITRLAPGRHSVTLGDVAENCAVADSNPHFVDLDVGELAVVSFSVGCVAVSGIVEVTGATSGVDLDGNGYIVQVGDSGIQRTLPVNGSVAIFLPPGSHTLRLTDVAPNCTVVGENPRTVSVTAGSSTRDTARTTFEVTCVSATGIVEVRSTTSGAAPDPDGYTVFVSDYCNWCDFVATRPLGINDVVRIPVPSGYYLVWLGDIARNCSVDGAAQLEVVVTAADTVSLDFAVACPRPGSLQLTVAASGIDIDSEYRVTVRGPSVFDTTVVMAANRTLTLSDVPAGDYNLWLDDVALHCGVTSSNPASTSVPSGGTAVVVFDVACASLGTLQLTASTGGVDLDLDGYTFHVSGERFGTSGAILANETVTVSAVPGGDYTVSLTGIAINCDAGGQDPATVAVPPGGTATVGFDVNCSEAGQLAVTLPGAGGSTDVYLVRIDGTGLTQLTSHAARDAQPVWSPDGGTIAFVSTRDGNAEIYLMRAGGSGLTRLTAHPADDSDPSWSPDGSMIAFRSNRDGNAEIYVMQADGSGATRLTTNQATESDPAWSPDGSRIAFTSDRDGNAEIYVMQADGSSATRLTTNDVDDVEPAWSPDGARLAFSRLSWCYTGVCDYDLYVMNSDGSGATRLSSNTYYEVTSEVGAAWSPDGRWIAFGASHASCPWDCAPTYVAVEVVRLDGSRRTEVLRNALEPAWRP